MKIVFQMLVIMTVALSFSMCKSSSVKGGEHSSQMNKMEKEGIVDKYWKLIEINGQPVVMEQNAVREQIGRASCRERV